MAGRKKRFTALLIAVTMMIGITEGMSDAAFGADTDLLTYDTAQEPVLLTEEPLDRALFIDDSVSTSEDCDDEESDILREGIEEAGDNSDERTETVNTLKTELDTLSECTPGDDYIEDSAFFLADTIEEAERVASQYGAYLTSFSEGVAVITFAGKGTDMALKDAVDAYFSPEGSVSDTEKKDLPEVPVYPIYLSHLDVDPDNDPLYSTSNSDPKGQWFHRSVNTPGAWAMGADGSGVRVAVIDSGIDTANNDLNCEAVLFVEDSVFKNNPKYSTYIYDTGEDENGHGTHCAGIIAGLDNSIGGVGIAPNAAIISIRAASAEGELADSDIAMAIQMAIDNKVDIISMSFSGDHRNDAVNSKIQAAIKAGIVCIASAGNTGCGSDTYPAGYDGVISVGSYAEDGSLSSFSNYGSRVTFAAPGSDILSTMVGDPSAYMRKQNSFKDICTEGCSYGKLSGTSMAAPVAAGVAALVKSAHRDYSPDRIKQALMDSAPDKTYKNGSHTVKGGLNAANAVKTGGSGNEEDIIDDPIRPDDYLFFGVGDEIYVKAGKSVSLGVTTSLNNKKNRPVYSTDCSSGMITVDKTGKVKVNKKAIAGDSATVTVSCSTLSDTVKITVIDPKTATDSFSLQAENEILSTKEDIGSDSTRIFMTGGDTDRPYRLVLTGKGVACFRTGEREVSVTGSLQTEGGEIARVYAKKSGTATLTAYATDGSGCKASVKIRCVTPLKDVKLTYRNVPVAGRITMSQGSSLQLKAVAVDADNSVMKDKVKYTWSGEYVKKGRITAPDSEASFPVTVTAECNGFKAQKTVTIQVSRKMKTVYMGYFYENSRGKHSYINSVSMDKDKEGNAFSTLVCYGIETMPDLSGLKPKGGRSNLQGPVAFTRTGNNPAGYDNSSNESGRYTIDVKGPAVNSIVYGDYGVRCFTPGKKGNYRIIFTSLDGSGKTFTINLKVTAEGVIPGSDDIKWISGGFGGL